MECFVYCLFYMNLKNKDDFIKFLTLFNSNDFLKNELI